MTFEERNSIANPAAGLIVWCKNCWAKGELQVYNGYEWTNLVGDIAKSPIKKGDLYGGGVVGYVYINGDPGFVEGGTHGFVVKATNNVSLVWGCYTLELPGADSTLLGGGLQNTADIVRNTLELRTRHTANHQHYGRNQYSPTPRDLLKRNPLFGGSAALPFPGIPFGIPRHQTRYAFWCRSVFHSYI